MLQHICDLEALLANNGVEVKPWEWNPYGQQRGPPGPPPESGGVAVSDPTAAAEGWNRGGSLWFRTSRRTAARPHLPRAMLESRPPDSYLGVRSDSARLSSIKGTQL